MAPFLKDCGLNGYKGSVQRCPDCARATVHFLKPGGRPICGVCGVLAFWWAEAALWRRGELLSREVGR